MVPENERGARTGEAMLPDGGDKSLNFVGRIATLAAESSDVGDDAFVRPAGDGLRRDAEAHGHITPAEKRFLERGGDGCFVLRDHFAWINYIQPIGRRDARSSYSSL
jgi:hypothetical protein